jgi:hypothetical protein
MASRSSIVHLLLAALVGSTVALVLTQVQFSIWIDPSDSRQESPPIIEVDLPKEPTVAASPFPKVSSKPPFAVPNALRVSNRTPYPVRVVLRSRQGESAPVASQGQSKVDLPQPTHWDFAPQEGSQTGLLLSLPKGELRLSPGDVLMAFALDGSRRYWGPYVVGETLEPRQIPASSEWNLVLDP